jgi:DNA-binding NarL/FixJ family response regulator
VADRITVGVVDDHRLFRDGLAALFASVPDLELVGSAVDGEEAVVLAQTLHPDVLLMDIRMPGINGVEATRRVLAAAPDVAVVMLTMVDDDESVAEALREGARGYVLKDADQHEMLRVIRLAAGYDTARMSRTLHLSEKTVRNYLTTIPRRLGVADRAAAVELARKEGLGRPRS